MGNVRTLRMSGGQIERSTSEIPTNFLRFSAWSNCAVKLREREKPSIASGPGIGMIINEYYKIES